MIIKLKNFDIIIYNFKKNNQIIFIKSFINFNKILRIIKLNNLFLVPNQSSYKYSWLSNFINYDFDNNINYFYFKGNPTIFNKTILKNKNILLYDVITLKKKTSLLKKTFDVNYNILSKINDNKNFFTNNFDNVKINTSFNFDMNTSNFNKNLDLNVKIKSFLKNNRLLIKDLFNLKHYRKFSLNKNLKKISNFKKKNFIFFFGNRISNILMNSDFFFSFGDFLWFLKNGLISVNAFVIKNENFIIKPGDVINIVNSSYYYNFYKFFFNQLLLNMYKINLKFWSINKNKFKKVELKSDKQNYPKWIEYFKYFKKDLPLNIEVDYISMTIVILKYDFSVRNLNFYDFKFLNLYLNRLYNWKFII